MDSAARQCEQQLQKSLSIQLQHLLNNIYTRQPVWDRTNHSIRLDIDGDLGFYYGYESWQNIIQGIKTATTNIKSFQQLSRRHKSNDKDIAAALAKRNLLRHTKTIQTSSNKKFASVEFQPKEYMELLCSEPLQIDNHHIRFRPDTKFRKTSHYTLFNFSFFNIPTEAPDDALTEFLQQYADVVGEPFYPQQQFQGIYCNTVTRVCQVQKLYQHIPRNIRNMFGRTIKCIYDKQEEQVDSDRIIPFTDHDNNHHDKPTDSETEPENEAMQENQKQQPTTNENQ